MSAFRMTGVFLVTLGAVTACGAKGDKPASGAPAKTSNEFNADSSMSYMKQQVAFGPRVPGSPAWQKTGDWIVAQLRRTADTVVEQRWTHTLANGKALPMRNIFARFKPNAKERILYMTHWDSRPIAESESDPEKAKQPIPGANDGASGVALHLAIADALKKTPPNVGVDLLFTDGEDWGTFNPDVDVLIGSMYFAQHLPSPDYRPLFGVLWDMVGGTDFHFYQEVNSAQAAPEVVQKVWGTAKDMGYEKYFIPEAKTPITDDHVPLIKAGLRVVDVCDIDYPYHHMLSDTVDKVSVKSMKIVGDVAMALLR